MASDNDNTNYTLVTLTLTVRSDDANYVEGELNEALDIIGGDVTIHKDAITQTLNAPTLEDVTT